MQSHLPERPSSRSDAPAQNEGSQREAAGRLHAIFENINEGIVTADLSGRLLFWNRAALEMHGFTSSDDLALHLSEFFDLFAITTPQGQPVRTEDWPMARALRGERFSNYLLNVRRQDIDWQRIFSYGGNIILDDGGAQMVFLTIQDVTEQQRAQREARAAAERLRLLVEGVKDYAVFMLDPAGTILTWNAGAEQLSGFKADEIIGKNHELHFLPEEREAGKPRRDREQAAAGGSLDEAGWRLRKDGSCFWSSSTLTALYDRHGKVSGFANVTRDLTEWLQAEQRLNAVNERFRLLVEGVKDYAIFMLDPAGNILTWNSGAEHVTGYSAREIVGRNYELYFPPEDRAGGKPQRELERAAENGTLDEEGWRVRKDGSRFWANGMLTTLYDDQGNVRGFAKVTRDLTERHRLEERLLQQAAIIDSSDDAIISVSLQGVIQTWNPAAERIYGYAPHEVIGQPYTMLVLPERVGTFHERMAKLAGGAHVEPIETTRIRKDGGRFDILSRFSPILDAQGSVVGISAISRDISERKRLEAQLHQSQKMEAFGQLAGGVAHDFNNLLTVIGGFSELLLAQVPAEDAQRDPLMQIKLASDRAASLTRQLLAFSRKQFLEPKVLDLNTVVKDTEKMLQRLIGEDVVLAAVLAPNLRPVKVDPGQIEQVIMNLAVNARDAMPQGGKLTIQTQNVHLDAGYAKTHFEVKPGRYVLLAVSDTGGGMTAEVKARIFEPFFTTKGIGKGTGLGLAVVQGIVKQSGGNIEVYSEVGIGTTFKIYLPIALERLTLSNPGIPRPAQGNETILLVEDEDGVRELTAQALLSYQYKVFKATNGHDALRLVDGHDGKIDLLVTDVVMPAMSGSKLAETMQARYPGMKVLFLSGYMDDAVVRHGILQAEVAFLQKPFTPASLARKVRDVLDQT